RQLFSERGCLACHQHGAVAKADGDFPAIPGEATFGPDLSRLAAKINPENGDPDAKRRWLIQWVLDPKVHSPRTRMPVTHLHLEQAAAVVAWLSSREPEGWDVNKDLD